MTRRRLPCDAVLLGIVLGCTIVYLKLHEGDSARLAANQRSGNWQQVNVFVGNPAQKLEETKLEEPLEVCFLGSISSFY